MSLSHRALFAIVLLAAAVSLAAAPRAQQAPIVPPGNAQGALLKDLGNLSDKFAGLARVMAGKYDWRPMPGVRSVGEVFNLIVGENTMLAGLLTGAPAGRGGGANPAPPITDPAAMADALRSSYAKVSEALSGLSPADLQASVTLFGQSTTRQGAALMLLMDQHEHLGQSIAYARTNRVVPPWSQ